ncbi:DEAD/DEAH box helicase [Tepidiforma sp.]|uniref:DEAD/DEAH box helicase n=1 Tax=Tepidiforma sp. TaxID=2682230 RepID=UPI0026325CB4|nr:DEAD/DEAH box helicase [Tepidiforma sp.]MCX7618282.1 DEAD/DEAH box helicase [Tepidiforma sp.]
MKLTSIFETIARPFRRTAGAEAGIANLTPSTTTITAPAAPASGQGAAPRREPAPGSGAGTRRPSRLAAASPRETAAQAPAHPAQQEAADQPATAADAPSRRRRRRRRGRGAGTGESAEAPAAAVAARAPAGGKRPAAKAPLSEAFRELGVDQTGLEAIAALGFTEPTPIQREALPKLFAGEDLVGLAQTGTGKTLAFGLPLARSIDPASREVQAIVLVPTRELAKQVREVMDHLALFYGFSAWALTGGSKVKTDIDRLERGVQVVVGTPGRVIDHIKRGTLSLAAVRFVVLDEADQMLDIGFARDIDYILRHAPKERQTALFSATMPESIGRLVWRYMRRAERVEVDPEQRTAEGVEQYYCEVAERDKLRALQYLYEMRGLGRTLIFCNTKVMVDRLTAQLNAAGVPAQAIHGDLRQSQRDRVMADFRAGRLEFLVATNVAARGLDIPDIEDVVNYDVPQNPEEYIHRIGRTARAGRRGCSYTFVSEWDVPAWDAVVREVGEGTVQYLRVPARWDIEEPEPVAAGEAAGGGQ